MKVMVATTSPRAWRRATTAGRWTASSSSAARRWSATTPTACGCGRGFPGLGSCRATTTAMVVDRPEIDRAMLADVIRDSLERQGWLGGFDPDEVDELVEDEVELIERITAAFPVGAVLGREGTDVWERARRVA